MARKAIGEVKERRGKRGRTFALRFRAYGQRRYMTLGTADDGWDRRKAEAELANVMADVRRGIWRPPEPDPVPADPRPEPTFHEFATEWLRIQEPELAWKTVEVYRWVLEMHLLPVFAGYRLSQIGAAEVDRYKSAKASEGTLGAAQINKTLKVLAQVLDLAAEYGMLPEERKNPARGRRRRLREPATQRSWVEPEQLPSLLDAADSPLRSVLSTLAGGGLRCGEAVALDGRDVNLPTATISVGRAKTNAGAFRQVDMPGGLVEDLAAWRAVSPKTGQSDPVFVNREGRRQTVRNVEARIKTAIRNANKRLAELGIEPISERVSPHSLRRTYASLRYALGDDPVYVAEQMGHADAGELSVRLYAKAVKRRERLSGTYLTEYERALEWARMGTNGLDVATLVAEAANGSSRETASESRNLLLGPDSSAG